MLLKEMMDLRGKNAFVTGGTGFLGAHMCLALLEMGATVATVSRGKSRNFLAELRPDWGSGQEGLHHILGDLSNPQHVEFAVNEFRQMIGDIDILINNQFDWPRALKFGSQSWDDFEGTLRTGVVSPLYLTQLVFKHMSEKGNGGSIINVSSMYAKVSPDHSIYRDTPGMGNAVEYGASKAALSQATRYIAAIGGPYGIRCNSISPGPFPRSGAFEGKEWFKEELERKTMLRRVGEPSQLKGAVALLASDLGSYITGADIAVDGGWCSW